MKGIVKPTVELNQTATEGYCYSFGQHHNSAIPSPLYQSFILPK